jgi:hypothetical protein
MMLAGHIRMTTMWRVQAGDDEGPLVAHGDEHMRAEKYDKPENFNRKTHKETPTRSRRGRDHGDQGFIVNAALPRSYDP